MGVGLYPLAAVDKNTFIASFMYGVSSEWCTRDTCTQILYERCHL